MASATTLGSLQCPVLPRVDCRCGTERDGSVLRHTSSVRVEGEFCSYTRPGYSAGPNSLDTDFEFKLSLRPGDLGYESNGFSTRSHGAFPARILIKAPLLSEHVAD